MENLFVVILLKLKIIININNIEHGVIKLMPIPIFILGNIIVPNSPIKIICSIISDLYIFLFIMNTSLNTIQ